MLLQRSVFALALLCLACASYAEKIEYTEVIGELLRRDSISDVNLKQYNGFSDVVTRLEFEDRLVSLPNVINELPSVQTFSTGGIGSYSSASIRGSTGKQVNIFVDGILLSSPNSGFSNLGIIPASIVEAIEIYPDFTPVQLSDGNLAGAINIRTRKLNNNQSEGNMGGKLGMAYGSFNTLQSDASFWGGDTSNQLIMAGSLSSSDNDFPVNKKYFPSLSSGDSQHRENAAFDQQDFFAKYRHTFNAVYSLQVLSNLSAANNELPTIQNKTEAAATFDTSSLRNSIGLDADMDTIDWGVRLYNTNSENTYKDLQQSLSLFTQHIESTEKTLGSLLYIESSVQQHALSGSMDISETDIDKSSRLGNREQIDSSRHKITAAISDVWSLTPHLNIYGMARLYNIHDQSEAGTANFRASCSSNNQDCMKSQHQENSYQAGISYAFNPAWSIKSNFGYLLRIPTLAEKFGEFGNYIGDPNLQPETSHVIDGGVLFKNTHIEAQLTVFNKNIDDGIYVTYDSRGVGHPDNISQANIHGVEAVTTLLINDDLSWKLSGYNMDSENRSDIKANKGKMLHGIYHNGYFTSLTWCQTQHIISASYQVDEKLFYTPSNSIAGDKKDSLNVAYTFTYQDWTFNASADNVLNRRFSDFNRMPNMGRFLSTSVHYEF